jgi:hypothetical protein
MTLEKGSDAPDNKSPKPGPFGPYILALGPQRSTDFGPQLKPKDSKVQPAEPVHPVPLIDIAAEADRTLDLVAMKILAQQVINEMKNMKPLTLPRPKKYLAETTNEREKGILENAQDILTVKKEINIHALPAEQSLTEAMRNNRVLGIDLALDPLNPRLDQHAYLSQAMMQSLKRGGATHLIVPVEQKVLDQFMKSGKVTRDLMPGDAIHNRLAIEIQAALQSGLKLVSSGSNFEGHHDRSQAELRAVTEVLRDKTAKAVMITDNGRLADAQYGDGTASVGQLLRNLADPANPTEKIKLATVLLVDPKASRGGLAVMQDLRQPLAIVPQKTNAFKQLKVIGDLDALNGQAKTASSWNIVLALPY